MTSSKHSKVDRVHAPQNPRLWVDLYLDKDSGSFFADVGKERLTADTKKKAKEKIQARLSKLTQAAWREVIVVRTRKRKENDHHSTENGKPVYSCSCSFTYMRRERSVNPLKPKETIEREHQADFETRVREERERAASWRGYGKSGKEAADEREAALRQDRENLKGIDSQWSSFRDDEVEYEIPYTELAWEGIGRISIAMQETQRRLDDFAKSATPSKLAMLAAGEVLRFLPGPNAVSEANPREPARQRGLRDGE